MKDIKKRNMSIILIVFSSLLIIGLHLTSSFDRLENISFDAAAKYFRGDLETSDEVAVVLIDEASLQALNQVVGRWPWPRAIYSDLLEFFAMGEPRAIIFDILFVETQEKRVDGEIGMNDRALALSTMESENVYHAVQIIVDEEDEVNKTLLNKPMPKEFLDMFAIKGVEGEFKDEKKVNNYYLPFYELYMASKGIGVVEFASDPDGIYRRTKPLREYQGNLFPVAGIAPILDSQKTVIGEKDILIGNKSIPVDREGKVIINPYGKINSYSISGIFASLQSINEGDVENLMINPEEFRDKIVYIGASAVGVEDLKASPLSPLTPGVYLHASLASNYLMDDFLHYADSRITYLFIVIFSVICTLAVLFLGKFTQKLALPIICLFGWFAAYSHFFGANFLLELIPPASSIIFSGGFSFAFLAATEGREKAKVKRMFSQYVSPEVLNQMTEHFDEYSGTGVGSTVDLTIMFTDIRGFTAFSDKTEPEMVIKMLNAYLSQMCDVILKNQGTVDKFIGDAIMAFWGAPVKIENHAEMAVRSAIGMAQNMHLVNEKIREMGMDFEVRQGIGVNTGPAILGNIGSEKKLSYTVIGDTINLASRLESLNKQFPAPIIISEFTYERIKDTLPCRILGKVQVRGKRDMIGIYEALGFENEESTQKAWETAKVSNRAYELYSDGQPEEALKIYRSQEDVPIKEVYIRMCEEKIGEKE
jgi:adenylate cyclase